MSPVTDTLSSESLSVAAPWAPPPRTLLLATVATALIAVVTGAGALVLVTLFSDRGADVWNLAIGALFVGLASVAWSHVIRSWSRRVASRRSWDRNDPVTAREIAARSRTHSWSVLGLVAFLTIAMILVLFLTGQDGAVTRTFLDFDLMKLSWRSVLRGLLVNAQIAIVAGIASSLLGLLLALGRLAPGPSARPLRLLAITYIDLFRGLPSIVVIYLVCFGLPLAGFPVLSDFSPIWYAIIALTLTYGAYNAELFRSGIESVHPSQRSAALSLGIRPSDVVRFIVLPQVMRRIAPALLSSFVALQKDTALVNVVGIVDSFTQAKIYSTNYFNLSAITVVCVLFVAITIPQTRLVDALIARNDRRAVGGGTR